MQNQHTIKLDNPQAAQWLEEFKTLIDQFPVPIKQCANIQPEHLLSRRAVKFDTQLTEQLEQLNNKINV